MLNISGLKQGIVIDHIKAGLSMKIYDYLQLDKLDCSVAIIKNAKSSKMHKKDIIKIEDSIDIDLNILGFIDPDITVNIITDGEITSKKNLTLPHRVVNVIKCKNPRCITTTEHEIPHEFKLTNIENTTYRCIYCEQRFRNNW